MSLTERMIRAAKLDASLYEEVEADTGATGEAMTVVVISSVAAGIGAVAVGGLWIVVVTVIMALLGWFVWAALTYLIGTKLMPQPQTHADLGQLLRTIGFAASPGVLRVLAFIPGVGPLLAFVAGIWMLVATVIAVRQALDYDSTGRAIIVCLIGWIIQAIIIAIPMMMLGVGAGMAGG